MTQSETQAGWYPDPYDDGIERWWNGGGWSGAPRHRPGARCAAPAPGEPDRPAPVPAADRALLWPLTTAACGTAMVVGAFLPWTILSGTFGERVAVAGTSRGGDGWWSVVLGVVLAAAGLLSLPRPRRTATVVAALGAIGAAALMSYELTRRLSGSGVLGPTNSIGIWDVRLGAGLALACVAAVVSLLGAAGITGRDARAVRAG
jgi:hypothetical protein